MNPKEIIKNFLRKGQVMRIHQWAKENNVRDIERLIDAAARELKNERPGRW